MAERRAPLRARIAISCLESEWERSAPGELLRVQLVKVQ